jgi:hypothetical protein
MSAYDLHIYSRWSPAFSLSSLGTGYSRSMSPMWIFANTSRFFLIHGSIYIYIYCFVITYLSACCIENTSTLSVAIGSVWVATSSRPVATGSVQVATSSRRLQLVRAQLQSVPSGYNWSIVPVGIDVVSQLQLQGGCILYRECTLLHFSLLMCVYIYMISFIYTRL